MHASGRKIKNRYQRILKYLWYGCCGLFNWYVHNGFTESEAVGSCESRRAEDCETHQLRSGVGRAVVVNMKFKIDIRLRTYMCVPVCLSVCPFTSVAITCHGQTCQLRLGVARAIVANKNANSGSACAPFCACLSICLSLSVCPLTSAVITWTNIRMIRFCFSDL